ncbi:hypothetical protein TNCV_535651 [Trichonephila clavipes]|nr:hypothetical protein TNCV_535651 [Trichonephila clavipes]
MTEYTNAEKADMILAHGATDCNGRATQRLYAEKHPVRRTPAHTIYGRDHSQFKYNEVSLMKSGFHTVAFGGFLDDSALHPFHTHQYVQSLKECDFAPRQAFPQWYLQ